MTQKSRPGVPGCPGRFVITGEQKKTGYLLSGRALMEGSDLAVYLDDIGRISLSATAARYLLLLGGTLPVSASDGHEWTAERRDGGKGLWLYRGDDRFVIPSRSLMPVFSGKARKAPVFLWEGVEQGN